jgi:type IX secretion system PorP/SprF family membrane protein
MLTGRFQWVGLQDAPMTQTLSFRTRVLNNVGIGAYVYNDKNGYSYRQGGELTFAYHVPLTENSRYLMKDRSVERQLSFGLSAKVNHYTFSDELFSFENASDPTVANGGKDKGVYFNANFGIYLLWDDFFAGISATNLIPSKMAEFGNGEPVPPFLGFGFLGYDINLNDNMAIEPAIMFKMNQDANKQLDVNLKFLQTALPDNEDFSYWLQVSYRHSLDSGNGQALGLSPMGGIRFGGFHLAYAYSLGLTALNRHNSGTHEVMLGYTLCQTKHFCR